MRITRHTAEDVEEDLYLAGLNRCFPNWGGREMFDWCFRRRGAGFQPDLLVARDQGAIVGGSGISYRALRVASGEALRVGVFTGSWTVPEARGRGVFSRIIEETQLVAGERGAGLVVGFVTAANASRRGLEAAGATMRPSFYCRSGPMPDMTRLPSRPEGGARFVYTDDEWREQFLERPGRVEVIRGPGWSAAVEAAEGVDRIQAIQAADEDDAWRRVVARGRSLFCFTTIPERAEALATCGFEIIPGCVGVLGDGAERVTALDLENGDRI
jgi:Acetyltransferase (GNAT) domain